MNRVVVFEDEVHRRIISRILEYLSIDPTGIIDVSHRGKDYIDNNLPKYTQASNTTKVLVLRDLDNDYPCAPAYLAEKFRGVAANFNAENLCFRLAIREAEAWLVADKEGFSEFFRINQNILRGVEPESMIKPKAEMLALIRRGRHGGKFKRQFVQDDVIPLTQAPGYNSAIGEFISIWDVGAARRESNSLERAILDVERVFGEANQG